MNYTIVVVFSSRQVKMSHLWSIQYKIDVLSTNWQMKLVDRRLNARISHLSGLAMSLDMLPSLGALQSLNKFQRSQKTWIELTPPTHPPSNFLFVLETHHWHGQNTRIIITNNF